MVAWAFGILAIVFAAAGYALGARRATAREKALKTTIEEQGDKLVLLEQDLLRRSNLDPVTGLPTQQAFQECLEREWRRASRDRSAVSVLLIEVDHFRAYNDRLGKPEGDTCLRTVADAIRGLIHRPGDFLARYGQGKFGIVLGGTAGEGGMVLAEKVRCAVEQLKLANPVSPSSSIVTVSVGVAAIKPEREGAWQDLELIATAEKGLAQAKESGRNTVAKAV